MRRFISFLGRLVGVHFSPDNHVTPVLRLGRYHRVRGPGFFWIIPLLERTLPPVKTSLYVGNFFFEEVLSRDNIPFSIQMTVLFTFNPASANKNAAAVLVRGGERLLHIIVRDYTNQGLRRLTTRFMAEGLNYDTTMSGIEQDLARFLRATLVDLGLAPLKTGGVLIKETVAPDKFKRAMFDVRHDEAILEVLRAYPLPALLQGLNQVLLANSLKDLTGDVTLIMGSPEGMNPFPVLWPERAHQGNGSQPQEEA